MQARSHRAITPCTRHARQRPLTWSMHHATRQGFPTLCYGSPRKACITHHDTWKAGMYVPAQRQIPTQSLHHASRYLAGRDVRPSPTPNTVLAFPTLCYGSPHTTCVTHHDTWQAGMYVPTHCQIPCWLFRLGLSAMAHHAKPASRSRPGCLPVAWDLTFALACV